VHRLSYIVDNALLGTAIGGDSAYAVYWYSVTLNPGDLRTYVTYYGRSTLTTDLRPPLALGVHGPATLSVRDQQYSPDPFDIVATIANTGTAPATDVQLTLNLPPELTLAAGQTATQTVAGGELAVDAEQQLTWQVQATSQTTERVVTYSVTAAATNTAPKTVTRTITLPALVPVTPPPPPPATTSWYMDTVDTEMVRRMGCETGIAFYTRDMEQTGIVVLFFGGPFSNNDQDNLRYGTRLPGGRKFVSLDQIEEAARAWTDGFWACTDGSRRFNVRLAIATSNDGNEVNVTHGREWAGMINRIGSYIQNEGYRPQIAIAGATNIELLWNGPDATIAWVDGYESVNNHAFYNVGACEGCPYASRPLPDPNQAIFGIDWTLEDIWYVSWGSPAARPLPQIYATSGVNAEQWQYLADWALNIKGSRMRFAGSFTQRQACDTLDNPEPDCTGEDGKLGTNDDRNNTPEEGWRHLWIQLNRDDDTGQTPPFATDVNWPSR
jgi:hypothetical protein